MTYIQLLKSRLDKWKMTSLMLDDVEQEVVVSINLAEVMSLVKSYSILIEDYENTRKSNNR